MSSDDSRLGRWARRKAEARTRRGGAAPVVDKETGDNQPPEKPTNALPAEAPPDENLPEGLNLPDVDSLTAESDFSAFMKEGVPPVLRRLALRKLWSSDPMFNIVDEMVEYGEDYTNAAMIVEGVKSAWEPGRGYARNEEKPTAIDTEGAETLDAADSDAEPAAETESKYTEGEGTASTEIPEDESEEDPGLG